MEDVDDPVDDLLLRHCHVLVQIVNLPVLNQPHQLLVDLDLVSFLFGLHSTFISCLRLALYSSRALTTEVKSKD